MTELTTDRSGRTLKDYRELYWQSKERIAELEAQVANYENDAYVLSLLTKIDELTNS